MEFTIDRLEAAFEKFGELIDRFPIYDREEILFDEWSLRDIIVHINSWNLFRIDEIEALLLGEEITKITDFDNFNEEALESMADIDTDSIFEQYEDIYTEEIEALRRIPEDLINKPFWEDSLLTPNDWIHIDTEHLEEEHIPQLESELL